MYTTTDALGRSAAYGSQVNAESDARLIASRATLGRYYRYEAADGTVEYRSNTTDQTVATVKRAQ